MRLDFRKICSRTSLVLSNLYSGAGIGLLLHRVIGMRNPFFKKQDPLETSEGIIKATRKAAANESCCSVDAELDGYFRSARMSRTISRKLYRLAHLLELRRNGGELSVGERIAVRCALDTLRKRLKKDESSQDATGTF